MVDIETVEKALIVIFIVIPLVISGLILFTGLIAGAIQTWKEDAAAVIVDEESV